jgi:hypothetical protein
MKTTSPASDYEYSISSISIEEGVLKLGKFIRVEVSKQILASDSAKEFVIGKGGPSSPIMCNTKP